MSQRPEQIGWTITIVIVGVVLTVGWWGFLGYGLVQLVEKAI